MKKVTSRTGMEFTILDDDEIPCVHHEEWRKPYYEGVVINPNHEFVVGYGSDPVTAVFLAGWRCASCGFIHRDQPE